ncbi:YceD family protein [Riemerella columbina]|uniref:YceD family protein n=1 Tax=Riemerella columbina TaxID=103810 RepID=UPI0026708B95|nr:DUF177 domain-containing protein [Riemerella columbina]WKS95609.1 DUF177 domain-containing protein [Riemerella columbina]
MENFKAFDISFSGLKNGKHSFEFEIDNAFFELFGTEVDFDHPKITAEVVLDKHSSFLEFFISISGQVDLVCDISGEVFSQPTQHSIKVLVKFGETYNELDDEVITIPSSDYQFNVAQLIYEAVILSIPMKKIAPNVEENEEYEALLERYSPKFEEEKVIENEEEMDPRWAALQKLKNKN